MDQMHQASQEPIRRRDAGAVQVTERDILVLTWTSEQFCIAFDQLQRLLGRYAKAATKAPNVLTSLLPVTLSNVGYSLVSLRNHGRLSQDILLIGEGNIDDQVRYAIKCVCGEDRVVLSVQLVSKHLREPFPTGAKEFAVLSESSECVCESPCQWLDNVYWYADRSVVIRQSQLQTTLLGNVIRQLRE